MLQARLILARERTAYELVKTLRKTTAVGVTLTVRNNITLMAK